MALMNRFARLLRADAHAVLDRLEEPETLLRQAIREMEEALTGAVQELKRGELDERQSQARQREVEAQLVRVAGELDLAFAADNTPLARSLLRRRLEHERMHQHLDQRLSALTQTLVQRRRALEEQRQRLEALRHKAALFDVDAAAASETAVAASVDFVITDEDVELALLRERQQRSTP